MAFRRKRQHKPTEMIVLPEGAHDLRGPRERLASLGMNVDWFDFWLNGHRDLAADQAEQNLRWEKLCDQEVTSRPGHATFCVGTKHPM